MVIRHDGWAQEKKKHRQNKQMLKMDGKAIISVWKDVTFGKHNSFLKPEGQLSISQTNTNE